MSLKKYIYDLQNVLIKFYKINSAKQCLENELMEVVCNRLTAGVTIRKIREWFCLKTRLPDGILVYN